MGKIKNQSENERAIHRQAVALRKLSDEQLVERLNSWRTEGAITVKASAKDAELSESKRTAIQTNPEPNAVNRTAELIEELEKAGIFGIGKITIKKIRTFAEEKGYI